MTVREREEVVKRKERSSQNMLFKENKEEKRTVNVAA